MRRSFALARKMVPTDLCNQLTDTCTWRIARCPSSTRAETLVGSVLGALDGAPRASVECASRCRQSGGRGQRPILEALDRSSLRALPPTRSVFFSRAERASQPLTPTSRLASAEAPAHRHDCHPRHLVKDTDSRQPQASFLDECPLGPGLRRDLEREPATDTGTLPSGLGFRRSFARHDHLRGVPS